MLRVKEMSIGRFMAELGAAICGLDLEKVQLDDDGYIRNTGVSFIDAIKKAKYLDSLMHSDQSYGHIFERMKELFSEKTAGKNWFWIVPKGLVELIDSKPDYLNTLSENAMYYRIKATPISKRKSFMDTTEQVLLDLKAKYDIHVFNKGLAAFYVVDCKDSDVDIVIYESEPSKLRQVFQVPELVHGFTEMYA